MSQNGPLRLLVALSRVAATEAGGQQGDEWFALGLVEHGVRLGGNEQDGQQNGPLGTCFPRAGTFQVLEDRLLLTATQMKSDSSVAGWRFFGHFARWRLDLICAAVSNIHPGGTPAVCQTSA